MKDCTELLCALREFRGDVYVVMTSDYVELPVEEGHLTINGFGSGLTPSQIRAQVRQYRLFAEQVEFNIVLVTTHPVVLGCFDRKGRGTGQEFALYEQVWIEHEGCYAPVLDVHTEEWLAQLRMEDTYSRGRLTVEPLEPKVYPLKREELLRVPCGLIKKDGRLLLTQRLPGKECEGRWETPGGKAEEGETNAQALVRELQEELGVETEVVRLVAETMCFPPEVRKTCLVSLYEVRILGGGTPQPLEAADLRWFAAEELEGLDLCPANTILRSDLEKFLLD